MELNQFGLQTILVIHSATLEDHAKHLELVFGLYVESTTAVSETVQVRRLDGINTVATGKLALSKLMGLQSRIVYWQGVEWRTQRVRVE